MRAKAAEGFRSVRSKRKAITALLPYAIWQERCGKPEVLDTLLHAARASKKHKFLWKRAEQFASPLLSKGSPRAILLASPHIPWRLLGDRGDLVGLWAMATSKVPYTDEIGQSVVDTLLQIASETILLSYIPFEVWLWLTRPLSLPPVSLGRCNGTSTHIIGAIRELGDVGVLKSYFLLVWAEWDFIFAGGFTKMCDSIRIDFKGIDINRHRYHLIQRLDHIIEQLHQGLGYLEQHNPNLGEYHFQKMGDQYGALRDLLLEMDADAEREAHCLRKSYPTFCSFCILTRTGMHSIPCNVYVCTSSHVTVASCPTLEREPQTSFPPPAPIREFRYLRFFITHAHIVLVKSTVSRVPSH